jgi:hypothetical protein
MEARSVCLTATRSTQASDEENDRLMAGLPFESIKDCNDGNPFRRNRLLSLRAFIMAIAQVARRSAIDVGLTRGYSRRHGSLNQPTRRSQFAVNPFEPDQLPQAFAQVGRGSSQLLHK